MIQVFRFDAWLTSICHRLCLVRADPWQVDQSTEFRFSYFPSLLLRESFTLVDPLSIDHSQTCFEAASPLWPDPEIVTFCSSTWDTQIPPQMAYYDGCCTFWYFARQR